MGEITEGRLRKRIAKLTQQRDHWKARADQLTEMLKLYPYIERHHEDWQKRVAEQKRLRELEAIYEPLVRELERMKKKT